LTKYFALKVLRHATDDEVQEISTVQYAAKFKQFDSSVFTFEPIQKHLALGHMINQQPAQSLDRLQTSCATGTTLSFEASGGDKFESLSTTNQLGLQRN
jgi:hypothetical protein